MSAKEADPSRANLLQKKSGLKAPVKRVILKIARIHDDPDFNQSALRKEESKLVRLNELNHPAIVKILPIRPKVYLARADLLGQPWFMVLEYLEGGSLRDLLVNTKKVQKDEFAALDLEMALQIVHTLTGALVAIHAPHETEYGHDPGIAHLDIKPGNILFRTKPVQGEVVEPVLVDFGIAGDIGHGDLEAGTLQYMSRERIRYVKEWEKPDGGMDVFSLGVVLYEMLAGRHPFLWRLEAQTKRELTDEEIIDAVCNVTPAPVSDYASSIPKAVRPRLDALVSNMLADDPSTRPDPALLQTETQEILSLTKRARGRKYLINRLVAVGLLFLAAVLGYFSWPLIRQSASTIANSFRTPRRLWWSHLQSPQLLQYPPLSHQPIPLYYHPPLPYPPLYQ
ncbi:MAG: serine/threonine-protein kinase [Caldilineaceae bacterium]